MPTSALHKIRPRRADFMDISNGSYEIIPIEGIISLGPMWASAPTGAKLNDNLHFQQFLDGVNFCVIAIGGA